MDFVCLERRLVIEVDGGQHAIIESSDRQRTEWLEKEGYRVIRFWNHQVLQDLESVLDEIWKALDPKIVKL